MVNNIPLRRKFKQILKEAQKIRDNTVAPKRPYFSSVMRKQDRVIVEAQTTFINKKLLPLGLNGGVKSLARILSLDISGSLCSRLGKAAKKQGTTVNLNAIAFTYKHDRTMMHLFKF